jgi:hypothetical protein
MTSPTNKEIKVIRTDKSTNEKEIVDMAYALNKLEDLYKADVKKLLLSGLSLQNDFAYYQIETILNQKP